MLFFRRVIKSGLHKPYTGELTQLTTRWGEQLDPESVLPEHPDPMMARLKWTSLNGVWDYAFVRVDDPSTAWRDDLGAIEHDGTIIVPFSPEAQLSGVGKRPPEDALLVEERTFFQPSIGEGNRAILHFEAVDWSCSVWVNGVRVTEHIGGYLPFSCDITDQLHPGFNTLRVQVYDPSEKGGQLRGKQRIDRGTMWYTAQSGIWQSVWLEIVPKIRILSLSVEPDADAARVTVRAEVNGRNRPLAVVVNENGAAVGAGSGSPDGVVVELGSVHRWSPDDPHLYQLIVSYGDDRVRSYCAFRTVSVEPDASGRLRFCLNHEPFFAKGILTQGYWPDGLMTAPSDDALVFDIETCKRLGFNMMRMHIKLERARFYYHCDRLGMLVWQDMISGGGELSAWQTQQKPTLFPGSWTALDDSTPDAWEKLASADGAYRTEWTETARAVIERLSSHPCIAAWVLFNESWGQFCAADATRMARATDPTRPILSVSGWYDQGTGDIKGVHNYFRPQKVWRDDAVEPRAFMISEFGGLTWHIPEHAACPESYGYATFPSIEVWRDELRTLLASVDALEAEGLSGYVYTQVSDVEEETNGLMTYDRSVVKLDG